MSSQTAIACSEASYHWGRCTSNKWLWGYSLATKSLRRLPQPLEVKLCFRPAVAAARPKRLPVLPRACGKRPRSACPHVFAELGCEIPQNPCPVPSRAQLRLCLWLRGVPASGGLCRGKRGESSRRVSPSLAVTTRRCTSPWLKACFFASQSSWCFPWQGARSWG